MLTETWLTSNQFTSELFDLSNYTVFRKDRCNLLTGMEKGGGILIAIRSSLSCKQVNLLSNNNISEAKIDIDQLIVALLFNNNIEVFVMLSYIPPRSSLEVYNIHFNNCKNILENLNNFQHVICIGDFNQGNINWILDLDEKYFVPYNVNSEIEESIIDFYSQFDLIQINSFVNDNLRLLDLVFVDKEFFIVIEKSDLPLIQNSIHHVALEAKQTLMQ
ncbi:uncharacterized protein LOC129948821 [Eupeodes corollae]|uniref:uncharacterized protein LOC129948821 n=1 Tax=Eupeodes corollae TaxID=290404 RepID=UPI0024932917|nr:uncharacterized protein LOC129948821 [Eupeodes corollae]